MGSRGLVSDVNDTGFWAPDNHRLGRPIGHLSGVPRRDLGTPPSQGAADLADLGRGVGVTHQLRQVIDPLEGNRGVTVRVQFADGFLSGARRWRPARAVTGALPKRITVSEYAARWMTTYETAPTSTRTWHQGNLDRYILPVIGGRMLADVTPTEISRMLNRVRTSVISETPLAPYLSDW